MRTKNDIARQAIIFFAVFGLLILSSISALFSQEDTVTVSSYYPAPYGEYQELRLTPKDTAPSCTNAGTLYYNKDGNLYVCNGSAWVKLSGAMPTGGGPKYCPSIPTISYLRIINTNSQVNPTYNWLSTDCYAPPASALPETTAITCSTGNALQSLYFDNTGRFSLTSNPPSCIPKTQYSVDKTKLIWKRTDLAFPGAVFSYQDGYYGIATGFYMCSSGNVRTKLSYILTTNIGQPCGQKGAIAIVANDLFLNFGGLNPPDPCGQMSPPPGVNAGFFWSRLSWYELARYITCVCDYP